MSAQGPACDHKVWLNRTYAANDLDAANEYFTKDIKRVISVLDSQLRRRKGPFLLGPNISYADLTFVPHYLMRSLFVAGYDPAIEHPDFAAWSERLKSRPSVQKIVAVKEELAKGQ
ncbi:glutathione S-transferase [Thermothelomyces heterothallicus CBS 202.75]|uniref:glutathione S-transferase n=1 Tax=Thermothelomyces heterothallicus CBS 202.75 TaxID=1149848 RepID=UPI003742D21E